MESHEDVSYRPKAGIANLVLRIEKRIFNDAALINRIQDCIAFGYEPRRPDMSTVSVATRNYSAEVARHVHAFHQFVFPRSGNLEMEVGRSIGRVTSGTGAFIAAGNTHSFFARGQNAFVVLEMPAGGGGYPAEMSLPVFFEVGPDIRGLLDYATMGRGIESLSAHQQLAWSVLLLDRLVERGGSRDRADFQIERALSFMRDRLAESITVADIADAAGMSATCLHVTFRDRLSTTPHAHLMSLRAEAAARMLSITNLPIAEVAVRAGYGDQSTMTRALRRLRGQTPGEIRRSVNPVSLKKPKLP
ncbi:AraC family transcriptional regulator [Acidisoma sp. 7E03]